MSGPAASVGAMPWTSDHEPDAGDLAGRLVLDRDAGGHRHVLDGQPVPCGTVLELQAMRRVTDDGDEWLEPTDQWLPVRYEATLADRADDVRVHIFATAAGRTARIEWSPDMRFRWPAWD